MFHCAGTTSSSHTHLLVGTGGASASRLQSTMPRRARGRDLSELAFHVLPTNPVVELLGTGFPCFSFFEDPPYRFPERLHQSASLPTGHEGSLLPADTCHLFLIFAVLTGLRQHLIGWIWISLMTRGAGRLSMSTHLLRKRVRLGLLPIFQLGCLLWC